jgi:hypothetical protein
MHARGLVSLFRSHAQAIAHVNAFRIDGDLTRLQRAGERAGQSAAGCRHHVVERGRVGRVVLRPDPIVLRHLRVHPEDNRLGLGRHVREALRPAESLNPHAGDIRHLAHGASLPAPSP